uniref:Uncharacterized protein n=1 Tax=Zea mays TaxID=4577 RepID=A0A804PGI3_MAIZE
PRPVPFPSLLGCLRAPTWPIGVYLQTSRCRHRKGPTHTSNKRAHGLTHEAHRCIAVGVGSSTYENDGLDHSHGEWHLQASFLLYPKKHIHQILLHDALCICGHGCPPLLVLLDGVVHQLEHLAVVYRRPASRAADEARQPRRREQIAEAEPGADLHSLRDVLQELVPPLEPVADHGAHGRVVHELGDPLAEVHGLAPRGVLRDGSHEAADLLLPDAAERLHAAGAEQLQDADLAELPPQGAVARERQALPIRHHHLHRRAPRPRGEVGVVRLQDLPSSVGRRRDHDGDLTELEVDEGRLEPVRDVSHGTVRERAADEQVVEAADHRQTPWARRQPQAIVVVSPLELQEQEGKEGQEEVQVVRERIHDMASDAVNG